MQVRSESAKQPSSAPAGLVFTGCGLAAAARAQAAARKPGKGKAKAKAGGGRREVKIGGRRVTTIDVHAHCVIPAAMALLGLRMEDQRGPGMGEVGARRIREMDAQGIDMEALSINPYWYKAERLIRTCRARLR
jgi:aminocarboxymuconate-semialdehyde decarboxylase